MVATTKTIWWPGHRRASPLFLPRPCLHVNARTGRVLGAGEVEEGGNNCVSCTFNPSVVLSGMPKGRGRREGKIARGAEGEGFLAGHERLSGSQWTKLSNNKVEATVCSASSSSFPFLIHSLSDSCASSALSLPCGACTCLFQSRCAFPAVHYFSLWQCFANPSACPQPSFVF